MYPPPKYFPSNYTYHLSLHLALTLGCFFGVSLLSISNANSHPRISISLTNALLSENIAGSEVKRERLTLSSGDEGTDLSSIIIASLQLKKLLNMLLSLFVCREELLQVTSMPTTTPSYVSSRQTRKSERRGHIADIAEINDTSESR